MKKKFCRHKNFLPNIFFASKKFFAKKNCRKNCKKKFCPQKMFVKKKCLPKKVFAEKKNLREKYFCQKFFSANKIFCANIRFCEKKRIFCPKKISSKQIFAKKKNFRKIWQKQFFRKIFSRKNRNFGTSYFLPIQNFPQKIKSQ